MKKFLKIFGLSLIAVLFVGTLVFLYKKSQKKPDQFEIKSGSINNIIKKTVATGTVQPRKEIEIKPQLSGNIEKVYLEAGQMVHKNDVMDQINIIPDMVIINNAESRVKRSQLNYEDAKIDYAHQTTLFEKKVISKEEYQKARLAYN